MFNKPVGYIGKMDRCYAVNLVIWCFDHPDEQISYPCIPGLSDVRLFLSFQII